MSVIYIYNIPIRIVRDYVDVILPEDKNNRNLACQLLIRDVAFRLELARRYIDKLRQLGKDP